MQSVHKLRCGVFIEEDYNQQSVAVTIPPGSMMKHYTINIINDDIIECIEAFTLSIMDTWCGVNTDDNSNAQVIIIDDDGKNF